MTIRKSDKGDCYYGSVLPAHGISSDLPNIDGLTRIAVRNIVCNLPHGQTSVSSDAVLRYIEGYYPNLNNAKKLTIVNKMRAILNGCKATKTARMSYSFDLGNGNHNFVTAPEDSAYQYIVADGSNLKKLKVIPENLKDAMFILLFPNSKLPYGSTRMDDNLPVYYYAGYKEPARIPWSDSKYQYTYTEMQSLLASTNYSSYNYGIVDTQFVSIDCDNFELISELCPEYSDLMNSTFTVKSGRDETSTGYHSYFYCEDVPDYPRKKLSLVAKDTDEDLGDVRLHGKFFTVAPHSIHPDSGNEYTVSSDVPIRNIKWEELYSVIGSCIKEKHVPKRVIDEVDKHFAELKSSYTGTSPASKLGITCLDVLRPEDAFFNGRDYIGAHPVHGSETGHNLAVKADGSVWYCYRHHSGGGVIQAIAVAYEIRDCDDLACPFTKEEWKQIDGIIEELDPEHFEAYKQAGLANYRERKRAEALSEIDDELTKIMGGK